MPTTSRGYRYPAASAAPNVPLDLSNLAADVNTDLTALTGPWTSYTPTWTGATTNPVLGNGSITASYRALGKLIICAGVISMGSTTTYGSGTWLISLPATAKTSTPQILFPGGAYLHDASTVANRGAGAALLFDTTKLYVVPGTAGGSVGPTAPFTWVSGDALHWTLTYEAA